MSDAPVQSVTTQPAPVVALPAPPAPAVVTVEHISSLHRHLDQLASFVKTKFEEVVALVQKNGPAVAAAAAAAASAVPGIAPIAAAIEKVAGVAGEIAACCAHIDRQHNADGSCNVCSSCTGNGTAKAS